MTSPAGPAAAVPQDPGPAEPAQPTDQAERSDAGRPIPSAEPITPGDPLTPAEPMAANEPLTADEPVGDSASAGLADPVGAADFEHRAGTTEPAERSEGEGQLRDLAHDVRSPAATIAMLARCVEAEEGTPTPVRELAGQILHEADRIAELCADALEEPQPESVAVDDIVADVVKNRSRISGARIELLLARVETRAVRSGVTRVVANLVDNACRAAGPGGTVRVTVARRDHRVMLVVEDSGPGLPPDAWPSHHGPPVASTNARREARGLGIVTRSVQGLGGAIEHSTSNLGGAQLVVWLPAAPVARSGRKVRHSS